MSADEIKVLHVDDEESSLEVSQILLEEVDPHLRILNITSPTIALKELESKKYDLVLSDYKMPEMTGIQLAEKIKSHINIPFILYTGHGSEEVAEAAFKVGIADYVRKEVEPAHFQVLAKRIRQIVEQARGEKSLKASEEKFRQFFMNQPVLCCILSKEGNIVEVNETVTDTLGYTREELIGKPVITTLYSPSSRGKAEQLFRRWVETGELRNEELNIVTKTGEERTVLLNVDAVRDASGDAVQSISVQVDITQRRHMDEELRESEERYRTLVENSPNAISVTIGDTIVYANKKRADLAGKNDPSELFVTSALSQVAEGDRESIIEMIEARERGEKSPSPFEYRMLRADGSVRDIVDYLSEINYQGTYAVQHVLHDVTDQKRYEKRLEALHRHATELSKAGTMNDIAERTLDAVKSVLGFNQSGFGVVEGSVLHFIHMIGVSVGEGFELPLDGKGVTVRAIRTRKTQVVADIRNDEDYELGPAGRELGSLSELAVPVKIDGKVVAIINVESKKLDAFNEEDRKLLEVFAEHVASAISGCREEAEHRRYEQSLEALHRHASELQFAGNVQQVCELTLDAMEKTLDFKNASFLFVERGVLKEKGVRGTTILVLPLPLDGKGITVKAANTRRTVLVNDLRGDHDFVRGPIDSLSELATPVLIDGETVAVLNVESLDLNAFTIEDQTLLETLAQHVASALKRLGNLEVLRASEERYRAFLESSRDAVFVFDNNVYIYVNRAAVDMLGYDSPKEIIGLPSYSIVAPEEREEVMRRAAAKARGEAVPDMYEIRLLRRDGGVVPCEVNVSMIMYEGKPASLSITRDITERRKMENELHSYMGNIENRLEKKTQELIEAEVMSAAGKVAIMLGHDLRGPLQAIKGNLYLLRKSPEKAEERLKAIDDAVDRMGTMAAELRTKIRDTPLAVQAVDLADLAGLCLKETPVPPCVKTQLVVGAELDSVMLDPSKMRRVLDNLVRNAVEAMPEGGNLAISAERVGSEAVIKVSDTGVGIPEEVMRRLFRPFYTTKSGGLGLGLAYCRMAVEAHGGSITAESKVGEGTTFTVTLPLHPGAQPKNP